MRILVVEDNLINQKILQAILVKNNYQYEIADDGQAALDLLNGKNYDLILMDCQMPVLDGYETTKKIRQNESHLNLKRCPIVALTANAMTGDKEKCLNSGMDDFLSKPFKSFQILEVINKWTSRR